MGIESIAAGGALTALGSLGVLVLFMLSTVIPVHVTKKAVLPNGSVRYYGGGDILGYDFWAFMREYRLTAVLSLLLALAAAGIIVILIGRHIKNKKKKFS